MTRKLKLEQHSPQSSLLFAKAVLTMDEYSKQVVLEFTVTFKET